MHISSFFFTILLYLIVSSSLYFRSEGAFRILNRFSRFSEDMKVLLLDKVYVVNVLGTFSTLLCTQFLHLDTNLGKYQLKMRSYL